MSALTNGRQPQPVWRALIVEADTTRQLRIRSALRQSGHFADILSVRTPPEAFARLDAQTSDVVLAGGDAAGGVPLFEDRGFVPGRSDLGGRVVVITEAPLDPEIAADLRKRAEVAFVVSMPLSLQSVEAFLAALPGRA